MTHTVMLPYFFYLHFQLGSFFQLDIFRYASHQKQFGLYKPNTHRTYTHPHKIKKTQIILLENINLRLAREYF